MNLLPSGYNVPYLLVADMLACWRESKATYIPCICSKNGPVRSDPSLSSSAASYVSRCTAAAALLRVHEGAQSVPLKEPVRTCSNFSVAIMRSVLQRRIADFAGGMVAGAAFVAVVQQLSEEHVRNTQGGPLLPPFAHDGKGFQNQSAQPQTVPAETGASAIAGDDAGPLWRRFCKFGLPSEEHVQLKEDYCASINYRTRIPNWVAEHLTRESDTKGVDRKHSKFLSEASVPEMWRATNEDYRGAN
eukprot:6186166-Pleurochrysis_carterae.AAC.2